MSLSYLKSVVMTFCDILDPVTAQADVTDYEAGEDPLQSTVAQVAVLGIMHATAQCIRNALN